MRAYRYHVVSVAAVLIALAVGIVLGSASFCPTTAGAVAGAAGSDQVAGLTAERDAARADAARADDTLDRNAGALVGGRLADRTVVLVAAPDAAPDDLAGLADVVGQAGGRVTGTVRLSDAALAPDRADALRALVTRVLPAGVQLPSTTDAGTLAGSLLGSLVTRGTGPAPTPDEVGTAYAALADGGFVGPGQAPEQAQLAVVVAGDGSSATVPAGAEVPGRATALARIAGAIDAGGAGTVLTGPADGGALAAVRADPGLAGVSTVAGVGSAPGRIDAVLAARDQADGRT